MQRKKSCLLAALALAGLAACSSAPSPFQPLGEVTDGRAVEILRQRTDAARTMYAELELTAEAKDLAGRFDAVFRWQAPGQIRMDAFKDTVLSTRHLFRFVLTPSRFALHLERDDQPPLHDRGQAAELASRHPRFHEFFWAQEALFLPGWLPASPPPRVVRSPAELAIETRLANGAGVVWRADPRTLEVRRARVETGAGSTLELEYGDYRRAGEVFVPGRVTVKGRERKTAIEARLRKLEVNLALEPGLFDPDQLLR